MTDLRESLPTDYKDSAPLLSESTVQTFPSSQRPHNKPKLLEFLHEAPLTIFDIIKEVCTE